MATYGQLLIDTGGGIVDHSKQSARQEGATVIIGLGGTGSDAVMKIKKEIYRQLQPDDVGAPIPKYKDIKYLIIDSDDSKIKKQTGQIYDIKEPEEYFSIANQAIKATFAAKEVLKNRPELSWLDYEHISINDASQGAGGIRQVGRFLLVDKAQALYDKIKSVMLAALQGCGNGKLNIHICAGISGGTGSGTFLDVCYLVRQALAEIGKSEAKVSGYFFLPDVTLTIPEIAADSLKSGYVKVNGYCALQELDYCMNFVKNKDSFKMNYGFMRIDFSDIPVDSCYLISTTDAEGKMIDNGYPYAMGVVADFVISFLAKVQVPIGVAAVNDGGMTLEGHMSNLNTIKAGIQVQHGAIVDYNILGASVAEMPLSEIATYLGSKLFERYSSIYDRTPTERERDDFVVNNQLQYEDIRRALINGCTAEIQFPQRFDYEMFKARGNAPFIEYAENVFAANRGELEKNSTTFMEDVQDYQIPQNATSLISRTFKGLCDFYVTDINYGPFYAKRILYGNNNQNLLHKVDGYIKQNQEYIEHENRQNSLRNEEYEEAYARLQAANFLTAKIRMEDYLNALGNLYVHHYKVEMYSNLNTVLHAYRKQLVKLDQNFFNILTTVLDTLRDTFKKNAQVLLEGERTDNSYAWKILSIPDVQESLDAEVKKLDIGQTLFDLMITLFENCPKWISQDENEISKLISDFVLKEFQTATQKTITDYLKEKFGVDNTTLLAERIREEIIEGKLAKASVPLFWKNPMYNKNLGMYSTLTVPFDAAEIKAAAHTYAQAEGVTVRESGITDKLSMMCFYSGMPMFAYQGILELQRAYENDNKPGRHLYECGDVNWNKLLPAPIPASFKVTLPIERIENRNAKLLEEFKEAEDKKIIVRDGYGHWDILKTPDFDCNAFITEKGGYMTNGEIDGNKLAAIIREMEEKIDVAKKDVKEVRIEFGTSIVGSEEQVMKDFYLAAPVLNGIVKKELEKTYLWENALSELKNVASEANRRRAEQKDFFHAIFTGVISYGNKIVYTYNEHGIEKNVVLQSSEMELGSAGAYQAFITFKGLGGTLRKRIVDEAKLRMDEDDSQEVKMAIENLNANMAKRITVYRTEYDALHPLYKEITEFYDDFMKNFESFKLLH